MAEHRIVVRDRFVADRRRGSVIGSAVEGTAHRRLGIDREHVMSIDNDALRIGTMAARGWGIETVAYGPHERRAGLTLSVQVLNGHNTSEDYRIDSLLRRVARWALASETDSLWLRARRYASHRPRERVGRKIRYWWHNRSSAGLPEMKENLVVGWSPSATLDDPSVATGALVRATGTHNGQLETLIDGRPAARFRGLQNLPVSYVVVLREQGSITYAASSFDGARGLPRHPAMRPLGIDPRPLPEHLHAVIGQGLQGQIGFSCDTRVYDVTIAEIGELRSWCTTAIVADRLDGPTDIVGSTPEVGATWVAWDHHLVATPAPEAVGLVHALVRVAPTGRAGVLWRGHSAADRWSLTVGVDGCHLDVRHGGTTVRSAHADDPIELGVHSLQVLDDGHEVVVTLDGRVLFDGPIVDDRLADAVGVGVVVEGGSVRDFECHGRVVAVPAVIDQPPPTLELGAEIVVQDDLRLATDELAGREVDGHRWRRTMGDGVLRVEPGGPARFAASVAEPVPNRTAYTIDWSEGSFADIEIEMATPHRDVAGERCRTGLILWQDERNYFIVNAYLDDAYPAASASTFFYFRGFEDIYDAVWSNLGSLVTWGRPFRLRLLSDGRRYTVLLDDEPVLYRSFSDVYPSFDQLQIRRVGVVANWEWGHDTGSAVHSFVARRRSSPTDGDIQNASV